MKQLILLLLIISITIISWSSCAKSTEIQVHAIYYQSSTDSNLLKVNPIFSQHHSSEGLSVASNQSTNKSYNFFEFAIVFNEKLQQFIAFLSDLGDEFKALSHFDFSSSHTSSANESQSVSQKCNVDS